MPTSGKRMMIRNTCANGPIGCKIREKIKDDLRTKNKAAYKVSVDIQDMALISVGQGTSTISGDADIRVID